MKDAWYQMPEDAAPVRNSYNEHITYDKNGNIQSLQRNGDLDDPIYNVIIDNLEYLYDAIDKNRLLIVNDHEANPSGFNDDGVNQDDDYTYDDFGNMISDANKNITGILYNHLNLPVNIIFGSSSNAISYLYTATGVKVRKTVVQQLVMGQPSTTSHTDYLDGYQYYKGNLQFFPTAEGYVDHTVVEERHHYNYVYQYKDHLGNIRMNYAVDPADNVLKIKDENHYYPFGLKHSNYNSEAYSFREFNAGVRLLGKPPIGGELDLYPKDDYDYKYNGKEWQDELNLNLYDYGARNYDPAIGRWMNTDPLGEKYLSFSTYAYVGNMPTIMIDPDGRKWKTARDTRQAQGMIESADAQKAKAEFEKFIAQNEYDNAALIDDITGMKTALAKILNFSNIIKEMVEIVSNIKALEAHPLFFTFLDKLTPSDPTGSEDNVSYNLERKDNTVTIRYEKDFKSVLFHETKHAYQYIKGKGIRFDKRGIAISNGAWSANNEVEAYRVQYAISYDISKGKISGSWPDSKEVKSISEINFDWLKTIVAYVKGEIIHPYKKAVENAEEFNIEPK